MRADDDDHEQIFCDVRGYYFGKIAASDSPDCVWLFRSANHHRSALNRSGFRFARIENRIIETKTSRVDRPMHLVPGALHFAPRACQLAHSVKHMARNARAECLAPGAWHPAAMRRVLKSVTLGRLLVPGAWHLAAIQFLPKSVTAPGTRCLALGRHSAGY